MDKLEAIEYAENARRKLDAIKKGEADSLGQKVICILVEADEWIIYQIEAPPPRVKIQWHIETKEKGDPKGIINNRNLMNPCLQKLSLLEPKIVDQFGCKKIVADILSNAFYGNVNEAKLQFEELFLNIEKDFEERLKNTYIITAGFIVMVNISASIAAHYLMSPVNILKTLIYMATFGSLGGFISISTKFGSIEFGKNITAKIFRRYAAERILISMICGVVIFYAIKFNVIFGFIVKQRYSFYGCILFAVVAGYNEKLILDLLARLGHSKRKDKQNKTK